MLPVPEVCVERGVKMTGRTWPAYRRLLANGELRQRVISANRMLHECRLCGRACGVDRCQELGACRTGIDAVVANYGPHLGEEDPLRGSRGSGTIFFSLCNLRCRYCQNYEISQLGRGRETGPEGLATIMLTLQAQGCHNINLVSPTHVVPQILAALLIAAQAGLTIPLVYNSGGYDSVGALTLLDSVVDIYLPDMKYGDAHAGRTYSGVDDYPTVNQAAVYEMHRQVGDLVMDDRGVATRGLLVRHLVLPSGLAGTGVVAQFLARRVSEHTYINVMDQYRPCYEADQLPLIARRVSVDEWRGAIDSVHGAGLSRLDGRRGLDR